MTYRSIELRKVPSPIQFILAMVLLIGVAVSLRGDQPEKTPLHKKQVLFICTGNFYRSRFAEAYFNQLALKTNSAWVAFSRGLKLDPSQHNISHYAKRELIKRGVAAELYRGEPQPLTQADLDRSDYVVLMDEAEHRPMFEKQFPHPDASKIHYWHIPETNRENIPKACQTMATDVQKLL